MQTEPTVHLRQTFVERPGQDPGFFVAKDFVTKNATFNSTSPRFPKRDPLSEIPGPGSYESTQRQTFIKEHSSKLHDTHSVFRDTTDRMYDVKGYRGHLKN